MTEHLIKCRLQFRSEHTPVQIKQFQTAVGQLSAGYRNNNPPESFYDHHPIPSEQKLAAHAFPDEQYEFKKSKTENWSRAIFDKDEEQETDVTDTGDIGNVKYTLSPDIHCMFKSSKTILYKKFKPLNLTLINQNLTCSTYSRL